MSFSPAGESPLPSELAPASMFDSGSGSETGSGTHGGCKAAATGSPSGSASHGITVSEAHINSQAQIDPQGYAICRHCGLTGFLNDEAFEAHLRENEEEEAHVIVEEEQAVNGEEVVGGDFLVEEAVNEDDEVVEEVEDEDDDELVEEVVNEDDETVEEEVEDEDDDELVEEEAKKKKKKKDGVVCNFCGKRYETAAALEKHQKKYRMSYYKICGKCKNKLLCKGDYEVHRRGCKG